MYQYLVACLLLWSAYTIWKYRYLPPGPWGIPIFGYLPWLNPANPYITLTNLANKYGTVYGLKLGSIYTVVLSDPKIIKTTFSKSATTGRAPLWLTHGIMNGYGLICAEGELWKEHRRFTHNCLRKFGGTKIGAQRKKMESLILEHATDFTKFMQPEDGNEVDIFPGLRHSVGSAVNMIVFGKYWKRDDETWQWMQELQDEGPKYIGIAGPLNFLPFFRFFPKYQKIISFIKTGQHKTHNVYKDIIQEQQNILEKQISESNDASGENIIQCFLLEKKKKTLEVAEKLYNEQQLLHLLSDLFGAGLDTTLTSLRWYLLFLSKYPLIQNEVRKELNDNLGDRSPTMDDINQLPLLEASIMEAMRLRPVVPVGIPHGTTEDIVIEDYKIPKGTMLVTLQWALHMDPKNWDNPDDFNPRRFIDEDGKIKKSEYFMPFQAGNRMCVGDELAKMFLFLFSITILQKLSFSLSDPDFDTWGECGITLTPKDHKMKIRKVLKVVE